MEQLGKTGVGSRMLGAGDGMAGHGVHALRQRLHHGVARHGLARAHVGDDGAIFQMRADGLAHRPDRLHRHADDDEARTLDALADIGLGAIDEAEFERLGAVGRLSVMADDFIGEMLLLQHPAERRADEAQADQRHAIEVDRRAGAARHGLQLLTKSARAATVARISGSTPIVTRRQSGKP
jgi:hypothetical protein